MKRSVYTISMLLMLVMAFNQSVHSQTTLISYQGNLESSGSPANNLFDFKFRLFNSLTGGNQLGSEVTKTDVTVSEGVFTVDLDFGYAFDRSAIYLEILVKSSRVPGNYVLLTPRQRLTSTPTSLRSLKAVDADRLGGLTPSNYVRTNSTSFIRNSTTQSAGNFNITGDGAVARLIASINLGIGTTNVTNPLTTVGTGTDVGGVGGFNEVVARFNQNSTARHTAVSIDSTGGRDSILYLSNDGEANWGIRSDENTNEFQIRHHSGGNNNTLFRINERELKPGKYDVIIDADETILNQDVKIEGTLRYPGGTGLFIPGPVPPLCLDTIPTAGPSISAIVAPCANSSRRYKDNIEDYITGIELIRNLRPVIFNWKKSGIADFGLIAEEVAEVEPRLAFFDEDKRAEGVRYDRLGVVLINAINEQQDQIESQQKEIERQRIELEALKTLVCSTNRDAAICRK